MADALRNLDVDGDGNIDVGELASFNSSAQCAVRKSRLLTKLFAVMLLLWLLQLATNFAIVYAAVNVRGVLCH